MIIAKKYTDPLFSLQFSQKVTVNMKKVKYDFTLKYKICC